jgi:hypothetical protein
MKYDPNDGPPVLLLNGWATDVIQRLEGYRESNAMFGKSRQRAVSRLTKSWNPPSFENFNIADLAPPLEDLAKLKKWRLDEIKARTKHKRPYDEPFEETVARVERIAILPDFASANSLASIFFMGLADQLEWSLPHTREMAATLDQLSYELLKQQLDGYGGSLEGYKQTLLSSPLVPPEYWTHPVTGYDLRLLFEQATDWKTARDITQIVIFHQQLSLLALWDVEYCADRCKGLQHIPLFLQLAPGLRPRCSKSSRGGLRRVNQRKKDVVATPFAQLIDLIWCLLSLTRDDGWPGSFPKDPEMCETLNNYKGNLAYLRVGRPSLTRSKYQGLWPENVRNIDGEIIGPPDTLLAVVHLWDVINPQPPFIPVDQFYMRAWNAHRNTLGLSSAPNVTPVRSWPEWMDRGLDQPAPE